MSKIVLGTDNAVTKTDTTILDNVLNGAMAITAIASSEEQTEFYSKKAVGQAVAGALVGGFMIGDRFGDRVPFLGGRR